MKYIKPKSLTWWSAFVPLAMGLAAASTPIHGVAGVEETVANMTGGIEPFMLINAGLAGIGIRAAL